jgi:hypothetical protein
MSGFPPLRLRGDAIMNLRQFGWVRALVLSALGFFRLLVACKDDDPCDPGEIVKNSQCYPAPATGGQGDGIESGGAPDAAAGAPSAALDTPFGTSCADTTGATDCGGVAPVCADLTPLGQSLMCTQVECGAGEPNAGACPSTFTCFAPPGYPSVCIKK